MVEEAQAPGVQPAPTKHKPVPEWLWLLLILMLAVTVRSLFLAGWAGLPLFQMPFGDERNFHLTALALLERGDLPEAFFYQPFTTFYLAGCYALFGPHAGQVRTLQVLIGLLTVGLFYGLGRELAGRAGGRLAALGAALYGPFVFFEGQLLDPPLTVPLVCGGLWCLLAGDRRRRGWLLAPAGLLVGLATMARPNLVIVFPVAGLWWLLRVRPWRVTAMGAAAALLGLGLGLAPSWWLNARHGEGWLPVSASGGHSFFIGNNPQATGRYHVPRGERIDASNHEAYRQGLTALAAKALGHPPTPSEVSGYWYDRGFSFWRSQPGTALSLLGYKLLLTLNREETPIHHPYAVVTEMVPVLGWLPDFGLVLPFAVLGLWLGRRRSGVVLLGALAGIYLVTMAAYYVADRYRILTLPMLLPLAVVGILELRDRIATRGVRAGWIPLVVLVGVVVVAWLPLTSQRMQQKALYDTYLVMGQAMGNYGRLDKAEAYFLKAVELAGESHGSMARANLGLVHERHNRLDQARALYLQAAAIDSENRMARERLAILAEHDGDIAGALRWWRELAALEPDPVVPRAQIERLERLLPLTP